MRRLVRSGREKITLSETHGADGHWEILRHDKEKQKSFK